MNDLREFNADRLNELIEDLFDGSLTEAQAAELESMLAHPEARRRYLDATTTRAHLRWLSATEAGVSPTAPRTGDSASAPSDGRDVIAQVAPGRAANGPRSRIWQAIAAAVLLAAAGITALSLLPPDEGTHVTNEYRIPPGPAALLVDGGGAVWDESANAEALFDGSELTGESLHLRRGSADIAFGRGAVLSIIGHTDLRITGPNECRLDRGTLLARVPPSALGFTVVTPTARVVDHGTVFGVTVDAHGRTEVHVFEGQVTATGLHAGRSGVRLSTDQALRIDDAMQQHTELAAEPFELPHRWAPRKIELIDRARDSKNPGNMYALADTFDTAGDVERWAFFDNDNAGRLITPLIMRHVDNGRWTIVAIGATRTSDGSGAQEFDFEPVVGSAAFEPGDAFGWKEGADGVDNAGVIDHALTGGQTPVYYFGPAQTEVKAGKEYNVLKREEPTYSLRVRIRERLTRDQPGN